MTGILLHIGPLPGDGGQGSLTLYFLHPAVPDRPPVMAQTLAEAFALMAPPPGTACEPALSAEAQSLGLPVTALSDAAAHSLAMMALDLESDDFEVIEREGLIFQFCRACAAFAQAAPQGWLQSARLLRVVTGESQVLAGLVIGGPGLVIGSDPAAALQEGLAALLSDEAPPHVIDAWRRAYGLVALPTAFRLGDGTKHRLTDAELALLAACLFAVAALGPGAEPPPNGAAQGSPAAGEAQWPTVAGSVAQPTATGEVSVDGCQVQVTVSRAGLVPLNGQASRTQY